MVYNSASVRPGKARVTQLRCRTCGKTKPLSEFYNDNRSKHGAKRLDCKTCHSAARKEHHAKNKNRENQQARSWRTANLDRDKAAKRSYAESPRGIFHKIKDKARRRGIPFSLTLPWFTSWYSAQKRCRYCGYSHAELQARKVRHALRVTRLTIDRMDNSEGYTPTNICAACFRCNELKGDFFTYNDMLKIGRIIRHRHKEEEEDG